jgi:hypothetical protein
MKHLKLLLLLFFLIPCLSTNGQNQIPYSVFSAGGNSQSNSQNILFSTLGEGFIGASSNSSNQLLLGFWTAYKQNAVTSVKDEKSIPNEYKLEHNYPNPFNPSTTIRFSIPERSFVSLKVYDILGNEVTTLVNKDMETGNYETKFNADNYSSGIYIYKISAGNFINTRKMILVK